MIGDNRWSHRKSPQLSRTIPNHIVKVLNDVPITRKSSWWSKMIGYHPWSYRKFYLPYKIWDGRQTSPIIRYRKSYFLIYLKNARFPSLAMIGEFYNISDISFRTLLHKSFQKNWVVHEPKRHAYPFIKTPWWNKGSEDLRWIWW